MVANRWDIGNAQGYRVNRILIFFLLVLDKGGRELRIGWFWESCLVNGV